MDNTFTGNDIAKLKKLLSEVNNQKYESSKPRLIRDIVPIEVWLEDPFYSGPDNYKIYPYWKKVLCDIFQPDSNFTEVILSGSIGTGKSTVALYGLVRKLYEMSCYENIQGLYGLMGNSALAFIYFSLNLKQAEATGYGQIRAIIDSIPYFQKHFERVSNKTSILEFPSNINISCGSNNDHAIGTNLIGSILDEANFHKGESTSSNTIKEISKVSDLYDSIQARARSRFLYDGKNHAISFLVSSSTHKGSMTERRIKIAAEENFAHTYVASPKLWDVKGDRYSKDRFYVYTGSELLDPFIVNDYNDIKLIFNTHSEDIGKLTFEQACEKATKFENELFISVPMDFMKDFTTNIEKGIQDIAGVSTSPSGRLFSSRPLYNEVIGTKLKHPFTKEEITLSTGSDLRLEDFLRHGFEFPDPHKPHYIHIDAAIKGDSLGIGMSHVDSFILDDAGTRQPLFVVDIQLRINPPKPPHEIPLSKIRQFVVFLRDMMGINIIGVSYDQAHSSESRQLLKDAGFNVEYRSVDRKDEAYLNFCNLIYEKRVIDYKYSPFEEEFFNLIHFKDKRKVDHLPGYKKDISDGKVGSIQGLIEHIEEINSSLDTETIHIDSDEDMDDDYMISMDDLIDIDYL